MFTGFHLFDFHVKANFSVYIKPCFHVYQARTDRSRDREISRMGWLLEARAGSDSWLVRVNILWTNCISHIHIKMPVMLISEKVAFCSC